MSKAEERNERIMKPLRRGRQVVFDPREEVSVRTTSGNGASSRQARVAVAASKAAPEVPSYTPEEWHAMVATAAYFRAERRGFAGGSEEDDWLAAEAALRSAMELQ